MNGIEVLANQILEDLGNKKVSLNKPQKKKLSNLIACMLAERTPNLMILAEAIPKDIAKKDDRFKYISRFLNHESVNCFHVMKKYVDEICVKLTLNDENLILMLDQSKVGDNFEVLMMSARIGNRALPIGWIVKETKGAIGFEIQEKLLNEVHKMIPQNINIILMADRFYGTSNIVNWCQIHNWGYRIRLKKNIQFIHNDGYITPEEALKMNLLNLEKAQFNNTNIKTNIGIIHEKGHKEPWYIAMNCLPSEYTVLDYGMRWGIESMFSDFKSRGFGIIKTQLKNPKRIEKLILIMSLALYWAVSTGMLQTEKEPRSKKKPLDLGALFLQKALDI